MRNNEQLMMTNNEQGNRMHERFTSGAGVATLCAAHVYSWDEHAYSRGKHAYSWTAHAYSRDEHTYSRTAHASSLGGICYSLREILYSPGGVSILELKINAESIPSGQFINYAKNNLQ